MIQIIMHIPNPQKDHSIPFSQILTKNEAKGVYLRQKAITHVFIATRVRILNLKKIRNTYETEFVLFLAVLKHSVSSMG